MFKIFFVISKTHLQPVEVTEKTMNCGFFSKIFMTATLKKQLIVVRHIKHYIEDCLKKTLHFEFVISNNQF